MSEMLLNTCTCEPICTCTLAIFLKYKNIWQYNLGTTTCVYNGSFILKEKAFHTFKENKNSLIVKSLKRPKYKD